MLSLLLVVPPPQMELFPLDFEADQRYGVQPWIMTPYGHSQTEPKKAYYQALSKTCNIVERNFGLLKANSAVSTT